MQRAKSAGFSLVELLIVIAIIMVIAGIAIQNGHRARLNAVETIVVRQMQTIGQAQTQYLTQFGKYADTLAALGPAIDRQEGPSAARLIPASLASGEKNGYIFTLKITPEGYVVLAMSKVFGSTGRCTFYLDQDGVVHQNWGKEPADAASQEFQ